MKIKTLKYIFLKIDPTAQLSEDSKVKRTEVYVNPSFMQNMYTIKRVYTGMSILF